MKQTKVLKSNKSNEGIAEDIPQSNRIIDSNIYSHDSETNHRKRNNSPNHDRKVIYNMNDKVNPNFPNDHEVIYFFIQNTHSMLENYSLEDCYLLFLNIVQTIFFICILVRI